MEGYKSLTIFDGTSDDWMSFIYKFQMVVDAKDLLHIIERKDDEAVSTDDDEVAAERLKQKATRAKDDKTVKSLLVNKVSKDVLFNISGLKTAYLMVEKLKSIYSSSSTASSVFRLSRALDRKISSGEPIAKILGEINADIQAIEQAGGIDMDKLHVILLLRTFATDPTYKGVVESMKVLEEQALTKDKITHLLSEKFLEYNGGTQTKASKSAFEARNGRNSKDKITCHNCNKDGHKEADCWSPGGGAERQGPRSRDNKRSANNAESTTDKRKEKEQNYAFATDGPTGEWIRDSGAGHHYCNDQTLFENYESLENESVKVANGQQIKIHGKGSISFQANQSRGGTNQVTLKEVFYVPEMAVNLLSTAKLDKAGLDEHVAKGMARVVKDGKEIFHSKLVNNRWIVQWKANVPSESHQANLVVSEKIWHERLGHLSKSSLKRLRDMAVIKYSEETDPHVCEVCAKGKMKNLPHHPTRHPRPARPLDIVHWDWVVMNIEGFGGETVVLIGTDGHSGTKFAFPTSSRSGKSILEIYDTWKPWAERMTDRKLKCIRTDNAKEFSDGMFAEEMKRLGVEQQFSVPYEHKQNGTAESSNRILLDKARCMLIQSKLSQKYWPFAIQAAAFVANRSPVRGLDKVPIELFTGISPDMNKIKVFGSKCWFIVPTETRKGNKKLDARAKEGTFLGYASGGSAYKILDNLTQKVITAVSVRFEEREAGAYDSDSDSDSEATELGG
ncbi:DNA-directed DNA polymerase, partial [Chytriomyces confervae]